MAWSATAASPACASPSPISPGFLAKVAQLIGEAAGNIVEVHHGRAFSRLSAKSAELEIIVETRGPGHVREIVNRLMAMGYTVSLLDAAESTGSF